MSRQLLALYGVGQSLAWITIFAADLPSLLSLLFALGCCAHAVWVLPRHILLSSPEAFRGLRLDAQGWQLWSSRRGWQAVQLCPDSLALPLAVILRFRLPGEWRIRNVCVPRDSLARDVHRKLRLRLKFSRHRWTAPE